MNELEFEKIVLSNLEKAKLALADKDFETSLKIMNDTHLESLKYENIKIDRFSIVTYIIQICLKFNPSSALDYLTYLKEYQKYRQDSGQTEFLEGRIRYALNEKEEAKRLFKIAFQKSEGRIPDAKNPDYLKLVTEK